MAPENIMQKSFQFHFLPAKLNLPQEADVKNR